MDLQSIFEAAVKGGCSRLAAAIGIFYIAISVFDRLASLGRESPLFWPTSVVEVVLVILGIVAFWPYAFKRVS